MNHAERDPPDDEFSQILADCDQALAEGLDQQVVSPGSVPPELQSRLEQARPLLARLDRDRRARDQRSSGDSGTSAGELATPTEEAKGPPELGRFQCLRILGQGGGGVVFLAFDPVLGREVALKVPRPEMLLTPGLRRRFIHEARAAARLNHPNIVPVYDVGEAVAVCYAVTAYCPGGTLADWLHRRSGPVPVRGAAEIVVAIADAVQHAHDRHILHRDLKPANVLLGLPRTDDPASQNSLGLVPLVADFGLAKFLDPEDTPLPLVEDNSNLPKPLSLLTSQGRAGTPAYMAPEQADGNRELIGPATDVYGLGVILYEMLAGQRPFTATEPALIVKQVLGDEPVAPRRLRRGIPRDLETICLKCLRKLPARRYPTARDLADDLRRWLAGDSIHARRAGAVERAWKWARRHPPWVMVPAVILTAVAFLGAFLWQARDREELNQARERYAPQMTEAQRAWTGGDFPRLGQVLDGLRPAPGRPDLRGFEWHYLWRQFREGDFWLRHESAALCLAYSPDGQLLLSGGSDGMARLWDTTTGQCVGSFVGHTGPMTALAITPDGRTVATGGEDRAIRLWELITRGLITALNGHESRVNCLGFAPDGRSLVSGGQDHQVLIWDTATRRLRTGCQGHIEQVMTIAFAPDGQSFATAGNDNQILVWDAATGGRRIQLPRTAPPGFSQPLVYSPDGRLLVSGCEDNAAKFWDTASWTMHARVPGPGKLVQGLAFSPDGRTLAVSGTADENNFAGPLRLWDVQAVLKGTAPGQAMTRGFMLRAGSPADDEGQGVAVDVEGNIYVTGSFREMANFGSGQSLVALKSVGGADALVAKYTAAGHLVWVKSLGGPGSETGRAIALDGAGNICVAGSFEGSARFDSDLGSVPLSAEGRRAGFLVKLDPRGRLLWSRALGGGGSSEIRALAMGTDDCVYATGSYQGTLEVDPGSGHQPLSSTGASGAFVVRWDRNGQCGLSRSLGGSGDRAGHGIAADAEGNVYVTGRFRGTLGENLESAGGGVTSKGGWDAFAVKLNRAGAFVWARTIGGPGDDGGYGIALDRIGNVYIAGQSQGKAEAAPPRPGKALTSGRGMEAFLAKLSPGGDFLWKRPVGGGRADSANCVTVDKIGQVYLAGTFVETAGPYPGAKASNLIGKGSREGYVAQYSAEGEMLWFHELGGPGNSSVEGIVVDSAGRLFLTGAFKPYVEFECGSDRIGLTSAGGLDLFLGKLVPPPGKAWAMLEPSRTPGPKMVFSPDSRNLAWIDSGGIRIWHPKRPSEMPALMGHFPEEVWAVAFSPDGRTLASGGDNGDVPDNLKVWDATTGKLRWASRTHQQLVCCVSFSGDGKLLASADYAGKIKLWDPASGRELRTLAGHNGHVRCIAFSPDGRLLASGGHDEKDEIVRIWDVATGQSLRMFGGHSVQVRGVAFSPDGRSLASCSDDGKVRLWDVETGKLQHDYQDTSQVQCLAFTVDGQRIAYGTQDGRVKWLDIATGREKTFSGDHGGEVLAVAFTPDGRRLATAGGDGTARIWDPETGSELLRLKDHVMRVNSVCFSPTVDRLATASHDGTIRVYDAGQAEANQR